MNRTITKGLWVAALHVALVSSLAAKLLVDRATRPRVWARAAPVDPNLPIRGRYVSLRIEAVPDEQLSRTAAPQAQVRVRLLEQAGRLVAVPEDLPRGLSARVVDRAGAPRVVLDQPVAYFIPEHVADPSRRPPGEKLWVEVTLPRNGGPRPIRLGVRKDEVLTPLEMN